MNNGRGLSGDKQGLQISLGGSTPTVASTDYKKKYIELNKSLTALKRGNPTDWDLEVLGCSVDEFYKDTQYMTANNFNVKERAAFIKKLEAFGVNLFDVSKTKEALDMARSILDTHPEDKFWQAVELIMGNMLFNNNDTSFLWGCNTCSK